MHSLHKYVVFRDALIMRSFLDLMLTRPLHKCSKHYFQALLDGVQRTYFIGKLEILACIVLTTGALISKSWLLVGRRKLEFVLVLWASFYFYVDGHE